MKLRDYAKYIDHAILLPQYTDVDIEAACKEAINNEYACLAVTPSTLSKAVSILNNTNIHISSAIAFPNGTTTPTSKAFEAAESCRIGADEIDMVMNIGMAKMGNWSFIQREISLVKEAILAVRDDAILKVIIETSLLNREEKIEACKTCIRAHADFLKTSTGFFNGGATIEDIKMLHDIAGGEIKIKASGGIKTAEDFLKMIDAGADRIGTRFSKEILKGLKEDYHIEY